MGNGDDDALEQLTPLVEAELRRLARGDMRRGRRDHTLQTTALQSTDLETLDLVALLKAHAAKFVNLEGCTR